MTRETAIVLSGAITKKTCISYYNKLILYDNSANKSILVILPIFTKIIIFSDQQCVDSTDKF
jgi:hypothetical protein